MLIGTIITINGNHNVDCILLWSYLNEKQEHNLESAMKSPGKLQVRRKMTSRIVYDTPKNRENIHQLKR